VPRPVPPTPLSGGVHTVRHMQDARSFGTGLAGWGALHMSRALCVCVSVCIHAEQGMVMVMVWYGMTLSGVRVS
jgi:hypothetical protein